MRNDGNLARAKGLLLALMQEAYQRRDHVALLCFAGEVVELRLPPRRHMLMLCCVVLCCSGDEPVGGWQ